MCVWMWLSLCEIVILSVTVKNSLHSRKAAGPSQPQTNHPQITYHLSQRLPDLCLTCVLGLRKGCYYSTWYENDSLMSFKERCNSVTWWRWLPQVLSRRRDRERERERAREGKDGRRREEKRWKWKKVNGRSWNGEKKGHRKSPKMKRWKIEKRWHTATDTKTLTTLTEKKNGGEGHWLGNTECDQLKERKRGWRCAGLRTPSRATGWDQCELHTRVCDEWVTVSSQGDFIETFHPRLFTGHTWVILSCDLP